MKTSILLTAALFAASSFSIFAMQPPADTTPGAPAAASPVSPQSTQQPATEPETPAGSASPIQQQPGAAAQSQTDSSASSAAEAQPIDLKPVSGELVSKLDSKTAKTGDNVVIETKASVKTADGTEIPKGSKLTGHVIAVQPSGGSSANSQVAVNIDRAELKGGQTVPIHSEIQSVGSAETASDSSSAGSSAGSSAPSSSAPGASSAEAGGGSAGANGGSSAPGYAPGYTPGTTANAASSAPSAGTIVARNGRIAIRTTSVPGVLLANNAPGEQDPRMTQASGILLGAKKDVQLESGTKMVVGVSAVSGASTPAAGSGGAAAPGGAAQ